MIYLWLFFILFNGSLWAVDRLPGVTMLDPFDNSTINTSCSVATSDCIPQPNLGIKTSSSGATSDNTVIGNLTHPFNSSNPSQQFIATKETQANVVSLETFEAFIRLILGNFVFVAATNVLGFPADFANYMLIPAIAYLGIAALLYWRTGKG